MFNKLLYIREEHELTQNELAKLLKVDRSIIAKWENGLITIPLKHLNDYANYFNISLDYLTGLSDKKEIILTNKNLDKNIIGQRLKEIRNDNNLTLRSLAKELNTTSSTISAYETGKTLILTAFAYQICKKYDISLDYLAGKTNNKYIKKG